MVKPRKLNHRIESELKDFKKDIETKFAKSNMNQTYKFPLKESEKNTVTLITASTPI